MTKCVKQNQTLSSSEQLCVRDSQKPAGSSVFHVTELSEVFYFTCSEQITSPA